jgi:hypothetical protein
MKQEFGAIPTPTVQSGWEKETAKAWIIPRLSSGYAKYRDMIPVFASPSLFYPFPLKSFSSGFFVLVGAEGC